MKEDSKLIDFIKDRLEGNASGDPPRFDAILREASACARARALARRSRARIWGGALAAAMLAVACVFVVHLRQRPSPPGGMVVREAVSQEAQSGAVVADVIDILRVVDGEELEDEESTSEAEILLAWQDAPYEDAISGLFSEN